MRISCLYIDKKLSSEIYTILHMLRVEYKVTVCMVEKTWNPLKFPNTLYIFNDKKVANNQTEFTT